MLARRMADLLYIILFIGKSSETVLPSYPCQDSLPAV